MDRKHLYNDRIEQEMGGIVPNRTFITEEGVMACFNRYRNRIKTTRTEYEKTDSFSYALQHSYNSETIVLMNDTLADEEKTKYLSLINQGEKELLLSAPLELDLKVGSFIKWIKHDKVYLITKHYITEKSYFKADMKEANFLIRWEDDKDNVYESWASVTGPPETRFKSEQESHFYIDRANDSIDIWLPQNEETALLKRYEKVIIKGKAWIINIVDDITSDNIIKLNCVEDYVNRDKDDLESGIVGGKEDMKYRLASALDGLREIAVGKTLWFDPTLYKNDVAIDDVNFTYTIETMVGDEVVVSIGKDGFETVGEGVARIEIKPEGYPIESIFIINVVAQVYENTVVFALNGDKKVRQGFKATYILEKLINGEKIFIPQGQFSLSNRNLRVIEKSDYAITVEGVNIGTSTLTFDNGYEKASIEIEITSLFG